MALVIPGLMLNQGHSITPCQHSILFEYVQLATKKRYDIRFYWLFNMDPYLQWFITIPI